MPSTSVDKRAVIIACAALGGYLTLSGLWWAWGMHDGDWPLLMWLAHNWSSRDLSPLFVGHYPPGQLMLVWASPFNTLATAKLLNVAATVACAALIYATARLLAPKTAADRAWGLIALAVFSLSAEALLTGQSEFADPLALCALLGGIYAWYSGRSHWLVGLLFGLSGWFRLHFAFFGLGMALITLKPRVVLGWLGASAPLIAVNLTLHGVPFSPLTRQMLHQVLHGYDPYDLLGHCNSERPVTLLDLGHLMLRRTLELPKRHWPLLLIAPFGNRFLLVALLGYHFGVQALGWELTTRLMLPFMALLSLSTVSALAHRKWQHRAILLLLLFVVARTVITRHAIPEELARAVDAWDASEQLTDLLRDLGMKEPREAFVVDWRRAPTDTKTLSAFYNFGHWNLFNARYGLERPILQLRRNGVKFVVLSSKSAWKPADEPLTHMGGRTTDSVFIFSSADEADGAAGSQPSRLP